MSNLHDGLWPRLDRAAAWHDHASKPFKVIGWQNLGEQISHIQLGIHVRRSTDSAVSQNANPILATINMLKLRLDHGVISDLRYPGGTPTPHLQEISPTRDSG